MVRRYGHFADAEDAVQDALVAAATTWPTSGRPDQPLAWLIRVASRRMADTFRSDEARRRREVLASSWSATPPDPSPTDDDTLILFFMCAHPTLTSASVLALTLRAVGGLTTREIAAAFWVPEVTMAQRISRAKRTVAAIDAPFALPTPAERDERLRTVLHVLYLVFNEGYTASSGDRLVRADLSAEAIRLARLLHDSLPDDPEVAGLLALMLLTDARRYARTGPHGELIPLGEQDRTRWDTSQIAEGLAILTPALQRRPMGPYRAQAAIAALHDQAADHQTTDWPAILALYRVLEHLADNPIAAMNGAVALAMVEGPVAGLARLDELAPRLDDHYRLHAVRAHLLELDGRTDAARAEYVAAAQATASAPERDYLTKQAARLRVVG